jgi:hypothetical protein
LVSISAATAAIIVGLLLALSASGAAVVQGHAAPAVDPAPVAAANSNEVVVSVTGASGTQFRVLGEVFGDTGPIDLPDSGGDSAHFETAKPVDQLDLVVYVAAPIGDTTVGAQSSTTTSGSQAPSACHWRAPTPWPAG